MSRTQRIKKDLVFVMELAIIIGAVFLVKMIYPKEALEVIDKLPRDY